MPTESAAQPPERGGVEVLSNDELDERIRRCMEDISARVPELADRLTDYVWLRYGVSL